MDDVIKLIEAEWEPDEYGNQIEVIKEIREIFCTVRSVNRTEFYQAATAGLQPELIFRISHYRDYMGERDLLYTDWTGREKRYSVIRTYRDGDAIELTAAERIGDQNG